MEEFKGRWKGISGRTICWFNPFYFSNCCSHPKGSLLKLPDFSKLWKESLKVAFWKYGMGVLEAIEGWY